MRKIIKRLNKAHLAVFVPLTIAAYIAGGITPMFAVATATGFAYIAWQVFCDE